MALQINGGMEVGANHFLAGGHEAETIPVRSSREQHDTNGEANTVEVTIDVAYHCSIGTSASVICVLG